MFTVWQDLMRFFVLGHDYDKKIINICLPIFKYLKSHKLSIGYIVFSLFKVIRDMDRKTAK